MVGPVIPVGRHVAIRISLVGRSAGSSTICDGRISLCRSYSGSAFSGRWLCGDEILRILFKQRIEQVIDFELFGEFLGTLKFDPDTLEVHGTNFDDDAILFVFEDAVTFASGHSDNIQKLCAIDFIVV